MLRLLTASANQVELELDASYRCLDGRLGAGGSKIKTNPSCVSLAGAGAEPGNTCASFKR